MEGVSDPEDWTAIGLAQEYISRFGLEQFGDEAPDRQSLGGLEEEGRLGS